LSEGVGGNKFAWLCDTLPVVTEPTRSAPLGAWKYSAAVSECCLTRYRNVYSL